MIHVNGSHGEGGGQILRSSLAISAATGIPFTIDNIRANRPKPGLMRQHLACVHAAAKMSLARVEGDQVGSTRVVFVPKRPTATNTQPIRVDQAIGTAGSVVMVLQATLPAALASNAPSEFVIEGGTHNEFAPTWTFFEHSLAPVLATLGATIECVMDRPGFMPAGGGRVRVRVTPSSHRHPLRLIDRGNRVSQDVKVMHAHLPRAIAKAQLTQFSTVTGWTINEVASIVEHSTATCPGNALVAMMKHDNVTAVFQSIGRQGKSSHTVVQEVVDDLRDYMSSHSAAVCKHLADQLIVPIALLEGGSFTTGPLTTHTQTNLDTLALFFGPESATVSDREDKVREITVRACLGLEPQPRVLAKGSSVQS